ncbi:hypothetical protein TRVL_09553 [Trypanosoma vivax]|nr:hypothetical protein TRVL_09553 [Trypanosoma vivax]
MHRAPLESRGSALVFALLRWAFSLSDPGLMSRIVNAKHGLQAEGSSMPAMVSVVAGGVLRSTRAASPTSAITCSEPRSTGATMLSTGLARADSDSAAPDLKRSTSQPPCPR